jgi:hypothetical protein
VTFAWEPLIQSSNRYDGLQFISRGCGMQSMLKRKALPCFSKRLGMLCDIF